MDHPDTRQGNVLAGMSFERALEPFCWGSCAVSGRRRGEAMGRHSPSGPITISWGLMADDDVTRSVRERVQDAGETVLPAVIMLEPHDSLRRGTVWFLDAGHFLTNDHGVDTIDAKFRCRTINDAMFEAVVSGRGDGVRHLVLAVLETSFD